MKGIASHGLRQLPGLAVQRLSVDGYGFGGEGDWETSVLLCTAKAGRTIPMLECSLVWLNQDTQPLVANSTSEILFSGSFLGVERSREERRRGREEPRPAAANACSPDTAPTFLPAPQARRGHGRRRRPRAG
jgi:L-arabinose isomerase